MRKSHTAATNILWEIHPRGIGMNSAPAGVAKNREIKRRMCRFRAYLRLISLCNMLINTILYTISQISRLDTAYFSTPVILWLNAARCASAFDGDIRDAVMLKAQLINRCAHYPLRGRYRYWAQCCDINICRNNQAVGRTDNSWYGKENEKNGKHTGANAQFGRKVRKSR